MCHPYGICVISRHLRDTQVCDCCYIVEAHRALAQSIATCLRPETGVALIAYAHHAEHNRDAVDSFFATAEEEGLQEVASLGEVQLPPRCEGLPDWRFFVYARRLVRRRSGGEGADAPSSLA